MMTMKTKEQLLAQVILDYITEHPEKHDQSTWSDGDLNNDCGTTACVAGYAVLFTNDHRFELDSRGQLTPKIQFFDLVTFTQVGAELLGLTSWDARTLFTMTNNAQAKQALGYLARGEEIDWFAIGV